MGTVSISCAQGGVVETGSPEARKKDLSTYAYCGIPNRVMFSVQRIMGNKMVWLGFILQLATQVLPMPMHLSSPRDYKVQNTNLFVQTVAN